MEPTPRSGLLERDDELRLLRHVTDEAGERRGSVVLVSGEAGIGKSSLLQVWLADVGDVARVLTGTCEDLATPRPLGAFREMVGIGEDVRAGLEAGDAALTAEALLAELTNPLRATILALEDVHWADDATLDVIRFVGRRITNRPAVLVLTYRDDELDLAHPLQSLLGVMTSDHTFRLGLRGLSTDAIARLAGPDGPDPDHVAAVTGGNPFFVAQVLAEGTQEVPQTVVASVLGRLSQLPAPTREAVGLLATEPGGIEPSLLEALLPDAPRVLAPAEERGLFLDDATPRVRFRHELVRRAIADQLPPTQRGAHHRRMLAMLLEHRPDDTARILHHAAGADDGAVLAEVAPAAAREAFATGAHRQAASYEELALRHQQRLPPEERASLWGQHAWSLHYLHRSAEAIEAAAAALALHRRAGDDAASVRALTTLATMRFMAGDAIGGERDYDRAARLIADIDDPEAHAEFDVLRVTVNHLRGDHLAVLAEAPAVIERVEAGRRHDLVLLARIYHSGSRVLTGDAGGVDELVTALQDAHGQAPAWAEARAHLRLGAHLVVARRWDDAAATLQTAIDFFDDHGFQFHRHVAAGHLAHVYVEQGSWQQAEELLHPLADVIGRGGTAAAVPLHAAALRAIRTGDDGAEELVQACWEAGLQSRTEEHLARGATAMLEWAWVTEDRGIVDEVATPALESTRGTVRYGPVLWWLTLNGRDVEVPEGLQDPEAASLRGEWETAAAGWADLGMPYHRALELTRAPDGEALRGALELLIDLDARGVEPRVRRLLRDAGVRHIPHGPQAQTRANPAGLTPRQLEVLELLTDGLTNAEIAERLVLSVRTVDHHVSAILQKLEVGNREAAAEEATRQGIVSAHGSAHGRGVR